MGTCASRCSGLLSVLLHHLPTGFGGGAAGVGGCPPQGQLGQCVGAAFADGPCPGNCDCCAAHKMAAPSSCRIIIHCFALILQWLQLKLRLSTAGRKRGN